MALTILLIDTDEDRARALEEKLSESGFVGINQQDRQCHSGRAKG